MNWISLHRMISKPAYYANNFAGYMIPTIFYRHFLSYQLTRLNNEEKDIVKERVNYYVNLPKESYIASYIGTNINKFKFPIRSRHKYSTYFFDLYGNIRYFAPEKRFNYIFGDIDYEPSVPTFVKARPIKTGTTNSVICKFNKLRHFVFVNDSLDFRSKKNIMIFRNIVKKQPQRTRLISMYHNHPLCNVGQINDDDCKNHPEYKKGYMSINEMLKYKFICSIEGHDVATNLKWIMSSNSVAIMPKPKIESWFMEGKLIGGYHYIEIKDDYTDLEEKLCYYIANPQKAESIIQNAHEYIKQFQNKKLEKVISIQVIQRYFEGTGQS